MPEKRLAKARTTLPDGYQFGDAGRRIRGYTVVNAAIHGTDQKLTTVVAWEMTERGTWTFTEPTADSPWGV